MPDPGTLEEIVAYLPRHLVATIGTETALEQSPQLQDLPAAVLFADISGFTGLVETFSQGGPRGTETIANILNEYFGSVIDLITDCGGDVEKIAGDAILAFWPTDAGDDRDMRRACRQATDCALQIQRALNQLKIEQHGNLRMRIAVVAGAMRTLRVGGVEDRWQFLLTGKPLTTIEIILHKATPGETIVADAVRSSLPPNSRIVRKLDDGSAIVGFVEPPITQPPLLSVPDTIDSYGILVSYLPRSLRKRLAAGQHDWLGELRSVTVLFVGLAGLVCDSQKRRSIGAKRDGDHSTNYLSIRWQPAPIHDGR